MTERQKIKKQWFNAECRRARNQYHYARKLYNKQKSEHNKQFFRTVSKTYKCTILQCIRKTKEDRIKKIKTLKNSNSKEYWKYLNSDTEKPSCQLPVNELHDFFKDINSSPHANQSEVYDNCNMQNSDINEPINDEEIRKAINQLHNGKSSGIDNIKNEHIKSTAHVMIPIYKKNYLTLSWSAV